MYSHSDFGKSFKLFITEEPDKEIKDKFFNDLSSIDKQLIEYYKSINASDEKIWLLIRYKGTPSNTLERITVSAS